MNIKGLEVKQVLVEEQLDIVQEFYAGIIINSAQEVRGPVLMFSPDGGMDIESVSQDRIATLNVDVIKGLMPYDTLNLVASMGIGARHCASCPMPYSSCLACFRKWIAVPWRSIRWY